MRKILNYLAFVICAVFLTAMNGCSGRSFNYHSGNEIPEGSGIFTGEDGEFTLFSSGASPGGDSAEKAVAEDRPETGATAAAAAQGGDENREFQAFQEWQKQRADFEAFQQWKQSKQGSKEYQEFLEWQRWREYRQWQDQQKKSK